jgi:hypothetical protein
VPDEFAKPGGIDSSHLFDENSGGLTFDIDVGPKRGGACASRGRGYQHNGSGQQFGGLDNNTEAPTLLLVPPALRRAQDMDITSEHEGAP